MNFMQELECDYCLEPIQAGEEYLETNDGIYCCEDHLLIDYEEMGIIKQKIGKGEEEE